MSDSLRPYELQHARLPCPSLFPEVCSNSCPLSQWCHPTIPSSVVPFSCPQIFFFFFFNFFDGWSGRSKLLFQLPAPKIHLIYCPRIEDVSDIKLIRTDTTLDLSQKAEKRSALKFSSIKVFSNVLALGVRWSLRVCISPANQYSGLISFRIDWFDLLTVQGALKSLLNHHISKASILWHSAFIVKLSHPYMTTGKTIALTVWTFVGKVMFLLFNTLLRFVIAFLPRNKRLLISWLQSPSSVILEPKKTKPAHLFFLIYLPCHDGTRCHDLSVLNMEL